MKKWLLIVTALLMTVSAAMGQATPSPTGPANVYAAGVSYNQSGSPSFAGTALWAKLVNSGSGTYAFTVADALPSSHAPFTVSMNIGTGIAQKMFSIGKVSVFIPTSAGISFTGVNTGWSWTTGAMAVVKVKGNWLLLPNIRLIKSSVTGGTGYQPVISIMFGRAQ